MAVLLLECKEDEERQADFSSKKACQSILKMTASVVNGAILMKF